MNLYYSYNYNRRIEILAIFANTLDPRYVATALILSQYLAISKEFISPEFKALKSSNISSPAFLPQDTIVLGGTVYLTTRRWMCHYKSKK